MGVRAPVPNKTKKRREPDVVVRDALIPDMPATPTQEYRACSFRRNSRAIILDCGSHMFRAGFSAAPQLVQQYPPYVARIRDPNRPNLRHIVGYDALSPALRSTARPAFDSGLPTNPASVERLFDGALFALGLSNEERIDHPFVITEPPCVPNAARATFTELMFEAYDAPAVTYGIDALFAYAYNIRHKIAFDEPSFGHRNALILACGHSSTHVLPIVDGAFRPVASRRINLGGASMTAHLSTRLGLINREIAHYLSPAHVESLKHDLCRVSPDYNSELNSIWTDTAAYEKALRIIKLPFLSAPDKPQLSLEEQERARQARIENGKRLSEMMKAKRREKAAQAAAAAAEEGVPVEAPAVKYTEEEVAPLHEILAKRYKLQQIEQMREFDEDIYFMALVLNGFETEDAFRRKLDEREELLASVRDSIGEAKCNAAERAWWKRRFEDDLLSVPDADLPPDRVKEKRHKKALRGAAEARLRARKEKEAKKAEEEAKKEALRKRKEEDPEGFLRELIEERQSLADKKKRRKAAQNTSSDRRSLANRNRMRLIAEHAGRMKEDEGVHGNAKRSGRGRKGRGKGVSGVGSRAGVGKKTKSKKSSRAKKDGPEEDDDFGMRDSDWDVYRDMQVRKDPDSDSGSAAEEERLNEVRKLIFEMAPDLEDPTVEKREGSLLMLEPHPYPDEIPLVVDRYRVPELLFQPGLMGIEQAGLVESISSCLRSFPEYDRRNIVKEVFVAGGVGRMNGLEQRLIQDLRTAFPIDWGDDIANNLWKSKDPDLDAWNGAALFAEQGGEQFSRSQISRADYEEQGPDYLRENRFSNCFVERPPSPPPTKSRKNML